MIALCASLLLLAACAHAFEPVVVSGATGMTEGSTTTARAWGVKYWPADKPVVLWAAGASGAATASGDSYEAALDVGGNAMFVGVNAFFTLDVGFGYFEATAKLKANNNTAANSTQATADVDASALGFVLRLGHLFEFDDKDGNAVYSTGDTITGWYHLRARDWGRGIQCEVVGDAASNTRACTLHSADGVFGLRLIVTGAPVSASGVALTPMKVKIDFEMNWFGANLTYCNHTLTPVICALAGYHGPSRSDDVPNARIGMTALLVAKSASAQLSATAVNERRSMQMTSARGSQGVFEWETTADVLDASATKVGDTAVTLVEFDTCPADYMYADAINTALAEERAKPETSKAAFFVFSYDAVRPLRLLHDPEMGVDTLSADDETGTDTEPETTTAKDSKASRCVAASAAVDVRLPSGAIERRTAGELRAGDWVRAVADSGDDVFFSEVIANVHHAVEELSTLTQLRLASGAVLRVTPLHLVACGGATGAPVAAHTVRAGDSCRIVAAASQKVAFDRVLATSQSETAERVVAPVTKAGFVVLDAAVVSCFSAFRLFGVDIGHAFMQSVLAVPIGHTVHAMFPGAWDTPLLAHALHAFTRAADIVVDAPMSIAYAIGIASSL